MRILVHGINFSPELTGIGKYTGEMAEWLSRHGHQVEVITSPPYYPQWKIQRPFNNWWQTERRGDLFIMRGPIYVPTHVSSVKRILHEISFTITTFVFWIRALFIKYDLVFVICPVLQSGLVPVLLKYVKKYTLIVHVQDLQVDAAKQLGMVKSGKLIQWLEKIEKYIFNRSDIVSTISEGMRAKIIEKGIAPEKLLLFKNWVDTDSIFPVSEDLVSVYKQRYGYLPSDCIVLYSGNMGEKQGLEMILDVASELKQYSFLKFMLVGDGASKQKLMDEAKRRALNNVRFFPLVPQEELNGLLNCATIHLVLQKRGATDLVMPSKLGGILAAGGFVIVATEANSDLYHIIEENRVGKCIFPESKEELARHLLRFSSENVEEYKNNARNYALKELSKEALLLNFQQKIQSL